MSLLKYDLLIIAIVDKVLGADLAYMGTRFIATIESNASEEYKQMCTTSKDGPPPFFVPTVYTDKIR